MTKQVTFLNEVISKMTGNDNRNGAIAKLVESQDKPLAANRIAVTFDQLGEQRTKARLEAIRTGVQAPEVELKPEHMLSFVQNVMNSSCWAARRAITAGVQTDQANGLDFSQSVAEQVANLESASIHDVEATLMDDFAILNELHTWLCNRMSYMADLDPLFLFAEKVCVDEERNIWEHTHMIMDFNDVLPVLDERALEIAEKAAEKQSEEAATHVFGGNQTTNDKDIATTKQRLAKAEASFVQVESKRAALKTKVNEQIDEIATKIAGDDTTRKTRAVVIKNKIAARLDNATA